MSETREFLGALFDGAPRGAAVQLWHRDNKKTYYFGNLDAAADHVKSGYKTDIYVAAGLGAKISTPNKTRVPASSIAAIPGVWADIDVNGGPEGKTGAAPDFDDALWLATEFLAPSVIVHSGHGVQAWWLFEGGPWAFTSDAERQQAARLVHAYQNYLRSKAKEVGWNIDATHDLARLMRLPGTHNYKDPANPADVCILQHEGARVTIEGIGALCQEYMQSANEAMRRVTGEGIGIELRGDKAVPSFRVGQLMAVDVDFKNTWDRKKAGRTQTWSDSEFDLSLATRLAEAGCSDQEIADAIVHNRLQHGDSKNKSQRPDYIKQTIGKARLRHDLVEAERESERQRSDAAEQLESIAAQGSAAEPTRTVSLFTQLLGGPEVKELVQDSRDPDQARFRLALADGREVPIGTGSDLLNPEKFRSAFAVVTGHVVPGIKRDKWHKIVQALLHAATVNEETEDTRAARGLTWVRDFCDRGLSSDKDMACQAHDPFVADGEVFVPLGPFVHWLRRIKGERLAEADVKQLLIAAGFDRRTINYLRDTGRKSSRSYWIGSAEAVDMEVA